MASEFVSLGDTVRFAAFTHDASGVLKNADANPTYFVYRNDSDTITMQGTMSPRAGKTGVYRGYIVTASASGFSAGDYVEIEVSGAVGGQCDVFTPKTFVINDVYDANLIQVGGSGIPAVGTLRADIVSISGIPVTSSDYVANKVWGAQPTDYVTNNTFGSGLGKVAGDIYFADVKYDRDNVNNQDEFTAHWFKNSVRIASGQLTNPAISVFKTSDGTAVIANGVMSFINTGTVRYNQATQSSLFASGEPYYVVVSGTIDLVSRSWSKIVGLDYL